MLAWLERARGSVALPWCLAFVVIHLALPHSGGQNSASRFALLRAMARQHTFRIDRFRDWTVDLAVTPDPDRHYYSNKAPGPALLAFPIGVITEEPADDDNRAAPPGPRREGLLSLLVQGLPFAACVIAADLLLMAAGAPLAARHFFALAALFGNTASLLMSTFFGHGATAWLVLGLSLALLTRRHALAGLCYGFALLTDYSVAALLPATLLGLWLAADRKDFVRAFLRFCTGGVVPGVLWVWYHTSCFGNPWTLALAFQNPNLIDDKVSTGRIFGALSLLPSSRAVSGLLTGEGRGLLVTQPWAVVALVAGIARFRPALRTPTAPLLPLVLLGLPTLFWLNAGYRGWNGGWCPGPRYMSALMPLAALLAGYLYANLGKGVRVALWATLAASLVLFVLVISSFDILARPWVPIWAGYWTELRLDLIGRHGQRAALVVAILAVAAALPSGRGDGRHTPSSR